MAAAEPVRTARMYSRGRQEEQADDGRELAQRERVGLAPEVDLDDLELGDREGRGDDRPRDDGSVRRAPAVRGSRMM